MFPQRCIDSRILLVKDLLEVPLIKLLVILEIIARLAILLHGNTELLALFPRQVMAEDTWSHRLQIGLELKHGLFAVTRHLILLLLALQQWLLE